MCRHVAYLGAPLLLADLLYKPSNGLIQQSSDAHESRTRINGDGFGVGWYNQRVSPEPAVFKDISPAWNNANLKSLSDRVESRCILAHVRAARRFDPVSRANCHPFQHGRLLFMHNGDIPGRGRLHRRVCALADDELVARIAGNTDTELAFTLFLAQLGPVRAGDAPIYQIADALQRTVAQLVGWWRADGEQRPLVLNFCVSNGRSIAATRLALASPEQSSLHYCLGSRYTCDEGVSRMNRAETGPGCAIIASERLSDEVDWETIGQGQMVLIDSELQVTISDLAVAV